MVIVGMGNDLVHIPRIRKVLDKFGSKFLKRAYSDSEIRVYHDRAKKNPDRGVEYLASRWGIKEASYKVLSGCSSQRIPFPDISSKHTDSGMLTLDLRGRALDCAKNLGITRSHLFIDLMTTPNLTPSWVTREEQTFSVDLFPHIPAINSHIRTRTEEHKVKISGDQVKCRVNKPPDTMDPPTPPSSALPSSTADSSSLLEELEKELLALTERVNSNPIFQSVDESPSSSPSTSPPSSSPLPQPNLKLPSPPKKNKEKEIAKKEQPKEEQKSHPKQIIQSPKDNSLGKNIGPKTKNISPMSHKAFLSRVFGVNSGKKPNLTIAGRKVTTPADLVESNLRDRIYIPPHQPRESNFLSSRRVPEKTTPKNSLSPSHSRYASSATSPVQSAKFVKQEPISLDNDESEQNDDITEFTPTPKVNKKRKKRSFESSSRKLLQSKRRKISKNQEEQTSTKEKEIVEVSPSNDVIPIDDGTPLSSVTLNQLDSQISPSSLCELEFSMPTVSGQLTPLSMDPRLLNTQKAKTNPYSQQASQLASQCIQITESPVDSDEEFERLLSRTSTIKSPPTISKCSLESLSPLEERNKNSQFPTSSMDPLLLASAPSSKKEEHKKFTPSLERNDDPQITLLARENYVLKHKLHQLEATTEYYKQRVSQLTQLIENNCPHLLSEKTKKDSENL